MSNHEHRLAAIEQAAAAAGAGPIRTFVYYEDATTGAEGPRPDAEIMGTLDGEPCSLDEWKKIRTGNDVEIMVRYVDEKPRSEAGAHF